MAEDDIPDDGAETVAAGGGKRGGKKLIILVVPIVALLAVGAFFSGVLDPILGAGGDRAGEGEIAHGEPAVYYDLPEMLVNLNSSGRKTNFLKLIVSLELESDDDIAQLERVLPRIVDNFQVYLRELRIEDLRGSAGVYRLREELLARVNGAGNSIRVHDVLFKEMLVQ